MSVLSRLWAGEHRVYRDEATRRFTLDKHLDEPVAAFTCRLDEPFYESLRIEAEHELGRACEWRHV